MRVLVLTFLVIGQIYCDDRVYRFMIGDNWGAYEYTDERGFSQGFNPEIIKAVCTYAGKECYWTMDTYANCWRTGDDGEKPGRGLMASWYDGCSGFYPSILRENSFNFTVPYSAVSKVGLHYKAGAKVKDATDVKNKKIGFVNGWVMGPGCFNGKGGFENNREGLYKAVMFDTHQEMADAVRDGEIDACVTGDSSSPHAEAFQGLRNSGPWFACNDGGAAIMTQYGNDFVNWWNDAFEGFVASGQYADLCRRAKQRHGAQGNVNCL